MTKKSITEILNTKPKEDGNIAHYSAQEKCMAITEFMRSNTINFDLTFVKSVDDYYSTNGHCSHAQIGALDKIIRSYNISVGMWC